tara:strand:+ start:107 stop:832 length:726 start_codon:yes stop_codon:yes gene_type:complete
MKAPEGIPGDLFEGYSMDGLAQIEYNYANDCSDETQAMINTGFTKEAFDSSLERVKRREQNYYGPTDTWLYEALEKHPIKGKHVCLMGSTYPWYEALVIEHGAETCTVIEYSPRESFHEKIAYLQPHEVTAEHKFDACLSISSYEHDGLGRYGDPLNVDGDLEAMKNTKNLLVTDGLLYLSIPVGRDKVVYNVHRVYGVNRLPLLLEGWETVDRYGFFPESFTNNQNGMHGTPYQPVYVLK